MLSLPEDTHLCGLIDHAGDFPRLMRDGSIRAAAEPLSPVFPNVAGLAGHRRLYDEAVAASNRAIELEPSKQEFVSDLGWTLFLAGRLREAEEVLERAVSMDPANVCARNNLQMCKDKLSALEKKNTAPGARAARPRRRTTGVI